MKVVTEESRDTTPTQHTAKNNAIIYIYIIVFVRVSLLSVVADDCDSFLLVPCDVFTGKQMRQVASFFLHCTIYLRLVGTKGYKWSVRPSVSCHIFPSNTLLLLGVEFSPFFFNKFIFRVNLKMNECIFR